MVLRGGGKFAPLSNPGVTVLDRTRSSGLIQDKGQGPSSLFAPHLRAASRIMEPRWTSGDFYFA
jgi:hypothetical protein